MRRFAFLKENVAAVLSVVRSRRDMTRVILTDQRGWLQKTSFRCARDVTIMRNPTISISNCIESHSKRVLFPEVEPEVQIAPGGLMRRGFADLLWAVVGMFQCPALDVDRVDRTAGGFHVRSAPLGRFLADFRPAPDVILGRGLAGPAQRVGAGTRVYPRRGRQAELAGSWLRARQCGSNRKNGNDMPDIPRLGLENFKPRHTATEPHTGISRATSRHIRTKHRVILPRRGTASSAFSKK